MNLFKPKKMKARHYPITDYKHKDSRWDHYYKNLDYNQYIKTLDFDDTTTFLDKVFSKQEKDIAILDIGCGPGRHIYHLSQKGFQNISGLDQSDQGLKFIRDHCPHVKTNVGDATNLAYPDSSFDAVIMVGIVYEISEPHLHQRVFSEIARVLKSGGIFIFVNNSPYNFGEKIYTITQKIENFIKRVPLKFYNWRLEREDVTKHLRENGFSLIEEHPCNIYRGIFRFFYGIFASRSTVKKRKVRLQGENANTYSLHEYYLVQKEHSLLNILGRLIAKVTVKNFPYLFANTICYYAQKQ